MAVTYTKAQRDRAKRDGLTLATIAVKGLEFQGPVTEEERVEIERLMHAHLRRHAERIRKAQGVDK